MPQVQDTADRAFAPMLERNQKLQQIKNVMGVIKRFQSIFGLPARIRQLEELQDYSQVVTEYKRAKAMMAGSEVSTWISLFSEVEKVCAHRTAPRIVRFGSTSGVLCFSCFTLDHAIF